jgi:hypothetical protein
MRTTAPHSRAVFVAAGVVTVIATTAVGPSAAAPHTRPVVETFRVSSNPARPIFVVTGVGLSVPRPRPTLPPHNRRLCRLHTGGSVGYDYGSSFYLTVYTHRGGRRLFGAGRYYPRADELDCIGLVVLARAPKRIVFAFGSAYDQFNYERLVPGRFVTLVLNGVTASTTVRYAGTAG